MRRYIIGLLTLCCLVVTTGAHAQSAASKPKHQIRFGLQAAQQQITVEELKDVWKEAEALGFDTLWVNDHLLASVGPPEGSELEAWTLLAAMATVTSKVKIGAMVSSNTFRHPAILAKMATTVDLLSNGRLILGIGSGWFEREHQAYGVVFPSVKDRSKALGESLEVITKLWTAEPTASFKGEYYTLVDAPFMPKPAQKPHPPIMIGGIGEKRTLPLVAKYAQMWNIPNLAPDKIAEKGKVLADACKKVGRNCAEIEWSYLTPVYIKADPAAAQGLLENLAKLRNTTTDEARKSILVGNPAAIREQMQAYIDVGVTHFIINLRKPGLFDREGVRLFAKEVMPHFRQKAAQTATAK
ncbi:MAG: LLM class F420-dependent oxidoreductase [Deltaproteobacteria bacterium]|nr:LLM class F420-dependent oxidoreductase [Deltaproteobacteria bacterium]